MRWNPAVYLGYADERGRPFLDLLSRVGAEAPGAVVDLGCGAGNLTALLAQRWPEARVLGVDESPEMVERARRDHPELDVELGDARTWRPAEPVDVLVSNAMLQWVPEHLALLPRLVEAVAPEGWLALQVPGNFDEPSHVLRRELMTRPPYAFPTRGLREPHAHGAATYAAVLSDLGCSVDAWETTYLHELEGPQPVLRWISGTSARPALDALEPIGLREQFEAELGELLDEAYSPDDRGRVTMPFRRVFAVARRTG